METMRGLKHARPVVPFLAAAVLAIGLSIAPGYAQNQGDINPTAQAVKEQQLLQELNRIQGRITIPDGKASVLQQPQGREYQRFHEDALPWIGGIAVLGMLALLAVFFLIRGRIRTQARESGVKIRRFNAVERFAHWLTATAFIVLAVTGLNYVFGKRLLMPLIGPEAFSLWSQWAKYAHIAISWIFMAGIVVMFVIWIKDNIPDRYDWPWLKAGGGMFDKSNRTHPPAARFNAGQKLIFWAVILGGGALSVSGLFLLFPFAFADINGMQIAQYLHAIAGMVMIAIILAHIYIGSLGMEGAYQAMGTGEVDLVWAEEHHRIWVERERAQAEQGRRAPPPHAAPTSAN
jgi:formate dehydrogenase subunit gamma